MKDFNTPEKNSRRDLLKTMGAGGAALALSGFLPSELFRPAGDVTGAGGVYQVENVASLLRVPTGDLKNGDKIMVGGYYKDGDGGAKIVSWVAGSTKKDNGGTVHNPFDTNTVKGRYETVHNGTGDYRWFGILDETKPADEAFLAMVYDRSIHRIDARTNLLFNKRNRLTRSDITLNFNGFKVFTWGIEDGKSDDPFGAVFFFTGELIGKPFNYTLTADMHELCDLYEVSDATAFTIGEWYTLICNANAGGREDRELQKMCRVVEIPDATHVRFDYKLGWELKAGRTITYQKVLPVSGVRIENMLFEGAGRPVTAAGGNGSHPVAFEYATRCDVVNIHGTQIFWPLIIRRYNTHYKTEKCSLYNPIEVQVGGTGYLTQQLHCLYGSVRDCHSSKARHLNDFTCSAFCQVENCHNSGDNMGPFVTHGQYEHDLTYIGNSGYLTLANSGVTWGESAKRITIKKHVGHRIYCGRKITDLTLEDVHTFVQDGGGADSGSIQVNADGVSVRGCSAEAMFILSQRTSLSDRPNIIEGSTFRAVEGKALGSSTEIVTSPVTLRNCNYLSVSDNAFNNTGPLKFDCCTFIGNSSAAKPVIFHSKELTFTNCKFENAGVLLAGLHNQTVIFRGCEFGGSSDSPRITQYNQNEVSLEICDCTFTGGAGEVFISVADHAKLKSLKITGTCFTGGKNEYPADFLLSGGFLLIRDCVENGHNRGALPSEGKSVSHSGNIVY